MERAEECATVGAFNPATVLPPQQRSRVLLLANCRVPQCLKLKRDYKVNVSWSKELIALSISSSLHFLSHPLYSTHSNTIIISKNRKERTSMTFELLEFPFENYVYERTINKLLPIPKEVAKECISDYFSQIGINMNVEIQEIIHPDTYDINSILRGSIFNLILQVTQNCNLRCSYCAYSGQYYNRSHSNKTMSFQIAKQAVDFLFRHSIERPEITIGFYGGEPLLEFELIKKIVDYVESISWGKKVNYTVTTNATLLHGDILEYLAKHNFDVMISFDGPKEIHDKNRRFANGHGSYDLIMDNLAHIKQEYPEFYAKLLTNTVLSPDEDYDCVKKFFDADTMIKELGSRLSLVASEDSKIPIIFDETLLISEQTEMVKIILYMLGRISKETISKLYVSQANDIIHGYRKLKYDGFQKINRGHPGGPCTPGKQRLFVDVAGNMYPCEKISEGKTGVIGTLTSGFDMHAVCNMMNIGRLTESACKKCWAFIFCNQCITTCLDKGDISAEKRLANCQVTKQNARNLLMILAFLKHYSFDFERWDQ